MLRPRTTIDVTSTRARLDALQADLRREAEGAEADPFDEAMVAAVAGAAEAMKAQADALEAVQGLGARVAKRLARR